MFSEQLGSGSIWTYQSGAVPPASLSPFLTGTQGLQVGHWLKSHVSSWAQLGLKFDVHPTSQVSYRWETGLCYIPTLFGNYPIQPFSFLGCEFQASRLASLFPHPVLTEFQAWL